MTKLKETHVIDLSNESSRHGLQASEQLRLAALLKSAKEKNLSQLAPDHLYAISYINDKNKLVIENIKISHALALTQSSGQRIEPLYKIINEHKYSHDRQSYYVRARVSKIDVLSSADISSAFGIGAKPTKDDIQDQGILNPLIETLNQYIDELTSKKNSVFSKLFSQGLSGKLTIAKSYRDLLLRSDANNTSKVLLFYIMLKSDHDEKLSDNLAYQFNFKFPDDLGKMRETLMTSFDVTPGRDSEFDQIVDAIQHSIEVDKQEPFFGSDTLARLAKLSESSDNRLEDDWVKVQSSSSSR